MMKLLLWHCNNVSEKQNWEMKSWNNVLFLWACKEKGDVRTNLDKAVSEAKKATDYLKTSNVIISPFPYLSNKALGMIENEKNAERIQRRLKSKGLNVNMVSFEKADRIKFQLYGHRVSVGYRSV